MEAISKIVVGKLTTKAIDLLTDAVKTSPDSKDIVQTAIATHLQALCNRSSIVQSLGMPSPKSISEDTTALRIGKLPRKFRRTGEKTKYISEVELVSRTAHYAVLGDPGSGKTTTVMRLCRQFLQDGADLGNYQYPILVKAADIHDNLFCTIADELGLSYKVLENETQLSNKNVFEDEISDIERREEKSGGYVFAGARSYTIRKYLRGERPLRNFLVDVFSKTSAFIFIDGLDEVHPEKRRRLTKDIEFLAASATNYGLLVSCRSADYQDIVGFTQVEIAPLDNDEIDFIIDRWCDDPRPFKKELSKTPYRDLANRPLFLSQIILLYNYSGFLPEMPTDVYSRIVRLALEGWDKSRGIKRKSKYSGFDQQRKHDFLSAFAFRLQIERRSSNFNRKVLEAIYSELCPQFKLPKAEAEEVAEEIQSHTGIFVADGFDTYAFTHFSLLEYLCAEYIVREPAFENITDYIQTRPEILAVCVALAPDANRWMQACMKAARNFLNAGDDRAHASISSFLRRLSIERPNFYEDADLGLLINDLVVLAEESALSAESKTTIQRSFERLLWDPGIVNSLRVFFESCRLSSSYLTSDGSKLFHLDCLSPPEAILRANEGTQLVSPAWVMQKTNDAAPFLVYEADFASKLRLLDALEV